MSEKKSSKIEFFTPIHVIDLDLEKSSIIELKYMESNVNYDYSNQICDFPIEKRRDRSRLQLLRMGMVFFGIMLIFSIEGALSVPILLKLQISESVYSYILLIGPLLGFFFQPVLGLMSDRCQNPLGRRRPFILALSIIAFIGFALILNGSLIGDWLVDSNKNKQIISIVLIGVGITLLEFSTSSCDSPVRALLLDICNPNDQNTGLNIQAILAALGASFGYLLTTIDWENTNIPIGQSQILFIIAAILFIGSLFLTMTSAKEKRFMPKSKEINKSNDIFLVSEFFVKFVNYTENIEKIEKTENNDASYKNLYFSFRSMPKELIRLLICQLLGWMALYSNESFFTDFIAQSVFKGDPSANKNSTEYEMYNYGTKMGSWCLVAYSISSAISAIAFEKILIKKLTTKKLYTSTFLIYVFSCVVIYFLDNIYYIIPFCFSFGILLTTLTTLPYQMISRFHQDESYVNANKRFKRGIGMDCYMVGSCFFLAQIIVSLFMSLITSHFGNRAILVAAGIFGALGYFFALFFVIFPESKKNNIKPPILVKQ